MSSTQRKSFPCIICISTIYIYVPKEMLCSAIGFFLFSQCPFQGQRVGPDHFQWGLHCVLLQQVWFRNLCRCNGVHQWDEFADSSLSLNVLTILGYLARTLSYCWQLYHHQKVSPDGPFLAVHSKRASRCPATIAQGPAVGDGSVCGCTRSIRAGCA